MSSAARAEAAEASGAFSDRDQQREACDLGMWVFLTTETLFFGVLFFGYLMARVRFPEAFAAAGRHTDFALGTINTAMLLTSSLAMALAVRAAAIRRRRWAVLLLGATLTLGVAFLMIKGFEYRAEYLQHLVPGADFRFDAAQRDVAELFFWLYFVMTGIHAIHLAIGIVVIGVVAARLAFGGFALQSPLSVEMAGLYWHFVDVVWIFIYPCLYLIARS